jgi:tetraacyldisaccharide 4'-kinase
MAKNEIAPVEELQQRFAPLLRPLGWLNAQVMRMRARLYERGVLRQWEAPVPTVSLGNVSWGGTGKTPMTSWFMKWAANRGMEAAVLTRGYGARPHSVPLRVQPGNLVEEAGDEPLMLAKEHPDAHVVVDPVRTRGGKWLFEHYSPGIVLLDDGMQHMAVKRHADIVFLRPSDIAQNWNRVIPAGSWREDESALRRADCFMIKASPDYFKKINSHVRKRLGNLNRPVFSFSLSPKGFTQVLTGKFEKDFFGEPFLLVSGVGNPAQVQRAARRYFNYKPVDHMVYRDHHSYCKADVLDILTTAKRRGARYVLCTQKDAVKLGPMCTEDFWAFSLRVDFGPSCFAQGSSFGVWWNRRWKTLNREYDFGAPPGAGADDAATRETVEEHDGREKD